MTLSAAEARAEKIAQEDLKPVGQRGGFFSGTIPSVRDIWSRRELLGLLVRREIRARYKDSSLGLVWSLVRPLTQLAVYYFAIGQVLGAARSIPDFAIFVFIGLTIWGFFVEIVQSGTKSIVDNGGLIKKVYLPRDIFPLSSVGGALFNFSVQFAILLIVTVVVGKFPIGPQLLYAPAAFLIVIVYGTALALLLSAVNVYLRDIQHFVEVAVIVLFWASPIVYSYGFVHSALDGSWVEQVYLANPMTLAAIGMQKALWAAGADSVWPSDLWLRMLIVGLLGMALLWLFQRIFTRLQGDFAQEL